MRQEEARTSAVSSLPPATGASSVPVFRPASGLSAAIDACGATHPGPRARNEDQFLVADLEKLVTVRATSLERDASAPASMVRGHLLVVADGVGGHADGDQASTLATEAVVDHMLHGTAWLAGDGDASGHDVRADLRRAIELAHRTLREAATRGPAGRPQMATTLTLAYIAWPRLLVAHVGDSRCYLLRDAELELLTRDHTAAHRLIEEGLDAECIAPRLHNVLTNAVGGNGGVHVDIGEHRLIDGDALLLCADGLSSFVEHDTLRAAIEDAASAEAACHDLIERALEADTTDNITCVVARFRAPAQHRLARLPDADASAGGRPEDIAESAL